MSDINQTIDVSEYFADVKSVIDLPYEGVKVVRFAKSTAIVAITKDGNISEYDASMKCFVPVLINVGTTKRAMAYGNQTAYSQEIITNFYNDWEANPEEFKTIMT